MARFGVIAVGIILLVIGLPILIVGISQQQTAYGMYSMHGNVLYAQGESMKLAGSIFALLGFIVLIIGAAAGSKKSQSPPAFQITQTQSQTLPPVQTPPVSGTNIEYCYHCGGSMPSGSQFCKKCGRSQLSNPSNIQQQPPAASAAIQNCPNCGNKLTYMYSSQNWYCGTCEKHFA